MTTKEEIRSWIQRGINQKATHVLVVCDTFDYEDYPIFVSKDENAKTVAEKYNGKNMQRLMEVYNLSIDIENQLNERRAFHL